MSHVPWLHPEQLLWHPSLLSPSPCLLNSHLPASLDQTSELDWPDSGTHGYSRMRWQNWMAGEEIVEKKEQNEIILSNRYKSAWFKVHFTLLKMWLFSFSLWHSEFGLNRWQSQGFSAAAVALPLSSTKRDNSTINSSVTVNRMNYLGCRLTQPC